MRGRIRSRIDKLTAYERATATLCLKEGRWKPIIMGWHLMRVLDVFASASFEPPSNLALTDALREVQTFYGESPEDVVRKALKDPCGGLVLRYDPDPGPWSSRGAWAA